jgi:hypothetical protein
MKRIILLFGLIFSLVAVKANAGEPTNEQKAHTRSLAMQKALTLSEEQRVKVEAVLLTKLIEVEAVNNDVNLDKAAKHTAIETLQKQKDAELAAIMTPEQYAAFLKKREDLRTRKETSR